MKKEQVIKLILWIIAGIVFVVLTPELRDLVLFVMLAVLLTRIAKSRMPF